MRPGYLAMESRFPAATVTVLRRRGHQFELKGEWDLGWLCGVRGADNLVRAAATPRLMQAYGVGR